MQEDRAISQANLVRLEKLWGFVEQTPLSRQAVLGGLEELELDEETDQDKLNQEVEKVFNRLLMDTLVPGV